MYCDVHKTSPCLCSYDCDYVSTYSTSLRAKSSISRREPPHEASCCCNYNPFSDETMDREIHDLGFALRKLAVMKCHMKKWRMERLQLESETRSLKTKLQSLGVNVNEPVTEEPLIIHYRDENERLEKNREQLEDKIKDLETTISEHELFKNPCAGIQLIRENMRALREQSHREKKKFDETIKELTIKLAESGGESPCAGVNRLRAKLRELINSHGGKFIVGKNQQSGTIVENSIETLMVSSKSCDDLRVENKRIRVENQNLRRALKPAGDDAYVHSGAAKMHSAIIDQSKDDRIAIGNATDQTHDDDLSMKMKLRECNNLIEDLRRDVTKKDSIIQSLQKRISDDVEKMRINHESLMTEVTSDKAELKRCEEKVEKLLSQLGQSSPDLLESNRLKSHIEMVQLQFDELKIVRDKLLDEVNKFQEILSAKDDRINELLREKDKIINDSIEKYEVLQGTIELGIDGHKDTQDQNSMNHSPLSEEGARTMKKRIDDIGMEDLDSKIGRSKLVSSDELRDSAQLELTTLRKELDQLNINVDDSQRDSSNLRTDMMKQQIIEIQEELSNEIADNVDLRKLIDEPTSELNKLQLEIETLKTIIVEKDRDIDHFKTDISNDALEIDKLHRELENIKKDLDKVNDLNEELHALKSELMNFRNENEKLRNNLNDTKQECIQLDKAVSNFRSDVEALKSFNEKLKRDLISAQGDSQIQKIEADALKVDNAALKGEGDRLRSENANIKADLDNFQNMNENLSSELESLKSDSMKCYTERDRLTLELKKFGNEYARYKKEYDSSTRDLETLTKAHENSEKEVPNLQSSLNALQSEKESLRTTLNSIQLHEVDEMERNVTIKDIELEEAAGTKHELVALKNELRKCREELERRNRDLDPSKKQIGTLKNENRMAQDQLITPDKKADGDKIPEHIVDERDTLEEQLDVARISIEQVEGDAAPTNALLEEMDALKNTLGKLRKDLEKSNMENERLHSELDEWQNDAGKSRIQFEMDEIKLRNSRLEEDILRIRVEMEHITAEHNKLEAENGAMKMEKAKLLRKHKEKSNEPRNHVDDVETQEREIERVRMENNQSRNEPGAGWEELNSVPVYDDEIVVGEGKDKEDVSAVRVEHVNSEDPMEDTEYLRCENKKLSIYLQELKQDINKFKTENEILKANIDDSSKLNEAIIEKEKWRQIAEDLTRENDVWKNNLKIATDHLREIKCASEKMIENADSLQSESSSEYIQSKTVKQWSEKVERLNTEIQRLKKENYILKNNGDVPSTMQRLIDELAEWKKKAEDLEEENIMMRSRLSDEKTGSDNGSFDPESWLSSLTLTQLAELHGKICLLTSNLVGKDSSSVVCKKSDHTLSPSHNQNNLHQNYEVINRKKAALQRQITEKQRETGKKLFKMRQLLRREQAELIRISEAMNQEKKRNLMLHFTFDMPPCWVNKCTAKCAKKVKFISHGACEKL